jgi:hypothetical protein
MIIFWNKGACEERVDSESIAMRNHRIEIG